MQNWHPLLGLILHGNLLSLNMQHTHFVSCKNKARLLPSTIQPTKRRPTAPVKTVRPIKYWFDMLNYLCWSPLYFKNFSVRWWIVSCKVFWSLYENLLKLFTYAIMIILIIIVKIHNKDNMGDIIIILIHNILSLSFWICIICYLAILIWWGIWENSLISLLFSHLTVQVFVGLYCFQ